MDEGVHGPDSRLDLHVFTHRSDLSVPFNMLDEITNGVFCVIDLLEPLVLLDMALDNFQLGFRISWMLRHSLIMILIRPDMNILRRERLLINEIHLPYQDM